MSTKVLNYNNLITCNYLTQIEPTSICVFVYMRFHFSSFIELSLSENILFEVIFFKADYRIVKS